MKIGQNQLGQIQKETVGGSRFAILEEEIQDIDLISKDMETVDLGKSSQNPTNLAHDPMIMVHDNSFNLGKSDISATKPSNNFGKAGKNNQTSKKLNIHNAKNKLENITNIPEKKSSTIDSNDLLQGKENHPIQFGATKKATQTSPSTDQTLIQPDPSQNTATTHVSPTPITSLSPSPTGENHMHRGSDDQPLHDHSKPPDPPIGDGDTLMACAYANDSRVNSNSEASN